MATTNDRAKQTSGQKQRQKIHYPLGFILHLKDTVNPIIIRRMQLLNAAIVLVTVVALGIWVWNSYLRPATGEELVREMVGAAGGMDTWKALEQGKFSRTHKLYSETGELLRQREETFYFKKVDGNVKFMVDARAAEGPQVTIGKDKEGFWAVENNKFIDATNKSRDLGMMCDSEWCSPDCAMSMAFYRFSMPFKLTDNGVIPENAGLQPLGQSEAQVLDITFQPDVGRDRWVFYADPKDKLIRKMEYHHVSDHGTDRPEEFFWTDHREVDGLMISHKWTRYWSNGKVLEEYTFSDFDFETPLPDHFDERPEDLNLLAVN